MLYGRSAKDEIPAGNESGALWGASGAPSPWQGTTGNWYSDLLLRNMTFGFGEAARDSTTLIRWRDAEFYGGDSWKIHPRLNIEYGARWSFIRPEYLADNTYSGFRPDLFNPALGSDACNGIVIAKGGTNTCPALNSKAGTFASTRSLVPNNNHLIAPRFGFAWDVFGSQRFVLRGGIGQFFMRDPVGIAIRTRSVNPPFGVAGGGERALDGPLVAGTTLFDFVVSGHATEGLENNSNLANNWQWNLNTEMALWKDAKLQLGWVALRGIHLHSSHRANQIAPANRLAYVIRGLPVAMGGLNQDKGARKDLFPFGALTTDNITLWDHRGDSIYHSLQAMFSTRFTRNSLFQTAYTWSHNIANTTLEYVDTGIGATDSYNSRVGRGNADFDRRQLFSATLVYNLPTLEGQNSVLKAVAGGWEAGTIVSIASGPALTITGSVNNVGNPWGQGNGGDPGNVAGPRPNRVLSQPCHLNSRQWINPAAFTWDGFPLGGYPNSGPGQCAGPPNQNVDLSFDKNWNLPFHGSKYFGEKSRLQFRLEMFNLMNHPQFRFSHNNLTFDVQGATFAGNKVNCGSCTLGSSPFGKTPLLSNIGNREVQYALKLIF